MLFHFQAWHKCISKHFKRNNSEWLWMFFLKSSQHTQTHTETKMQLSILLNYELKSCEHTKFVEHQYFQLVSLRFICDQENFKPFSVVTFKNAFKWIKCKLLDFNLDEVFLSFITLMKVIYFCHLHAFYRWLAKN